MSDVSASESESSESETRAGISKSILLSESRAAMLTIASSSPPAEKKGFRTAAERVTGTECATAVVGRSEESGMKHEARARACDGLTSGVDGDAGASGGWRTPSAGQGFLG